MNIVCTDVAVGADGGKDVVVDISLRDGVEVFKRKWIVQCKFYQGSVSPVDISSINIPTLVHANKASGYLLVCRNKVTSGIKNLFDDLNKNCTMGYSYKIWDGATFISNILNYADDNLIKQYFPLYYQSTKS